jgi:hypothetical protein
VLMFSFTANYFLTVLGGSEGGASSVVLSTAGSSGLSPFTSFFLGTMCVSLVAARAVAAASSSSLSAKTKCKTLEIPLSRGLMFIKLIAWKL